MLTNISTIFYDIMFGDINANIPMSKLETKVLEKVSAILNNPTSLSTHIPTLPAMLVRLLNAIDNPDSSVQSFVEIIEQDPAFALAVLKTANSALYHRGEKEIVSLNRAITFLGLTGLLQIATTLLMAKVIPSKPIYYAMFGKQIWLHSVQCATLCELLASKQDENAFDAYFLGLIHDLGKVIIFDCLSKALAEEISSLPGTTIFKKLMTKMSVNISYLISIEWKLPKIYCEALEQQQTKPTSTLAVLLYNANQLGELYLMVNKGVISNAECKKMITKKAIDEDIWLNFTNIAPEIERNLI